MYNYVREYLVIFSMEAREQKLFKIPFGNIPSYKLQAQFRIGLALASEMVRNKFLTDFPLFDEVLLHSCCSV